MREFVNTTVLVGGSQVHSSPRSVKRAISALNNRIPGLVDPLANTLFVARTMWLGGEELTGVIRPTYEFDDSGHGRYPTVVVALCGREIARIDARSHYYEQFTGNVGYPPEAAWVEPTEFGEMLIEILSFGRDA